MKITDTIKRSSRNLRSAKLRTLLTALAIAVGGFALTLTLAASQGARDYTDKLISNNFDKNAVIVAKDKEFFENGTRSNPKEYSSDLASNRGLQFKQFDSQDIDKMKRLPHVVSVISNYENSAQYITRQGAKKYTSSLIVYDSSQKPQIKSGVAPNVLPNNSLLMPDQYLELLNFKSSDDAIGKTITVQVRQLSGQTSAKEYTITGITTKSSLDLGFMGAGVYISESEAKRLNGFINNGTIYADKVPTVLVRGDGISADTLKQEIQSLGFEARTSKDIQQFLNQIVNILGVIIAVFGFITLVASFFGVVNTQYISVLERTREIGLMKALGMSRGAVSFMFVIEATLIGLIGAVIGSLGGVLLGVLMNPWISKKINFGNEHLLVYKPVQLVILIILLMFITTVAGLLPALRASKQDPIEALRTE